MSEWNDYECKIADAVWAAGEWPLNVSELRDLLAEAARRGYELGYGVAQSS